jgi:pimeloyl-ACP methyl ester carboxylesterase
MTHQNFSKIVIVPGILGSELWVNGLNEFGVPNRRPIWSEDFNTAWRTLALEPNVFSSLDVEPGRVLRYFINVPTLSGRWSMYGPLFEWLIRSYSLREDDDLWGFAYDWRQDNRDSAKRLGEFLNQQTTEDDRVVLIAHSMGGLVCRALLLDNQFAHLEPRITKLIQLGTPTLGSAKAYYTLKNNPRLHPILDILLKYQQSRHPILYHYLYTSLQQFCSLFQLLPPTCQQVVFDLYGWQYSALDGNLWQPNVHQQIADANALHDLLPASHSDKVFALYSRDLDTERAYLINARKEVEKVCSPQVKGDGTVSAASAVAATPERNRFAFNYRIDHDELPSSPRVWDKLKDLL